MMNKLKMPLQVLSLSVLSTLSYAELTTEEKKELQYIIQAFKKNDVKTISQKIIYPLEREQPLKAIKNTKEMQQRFDQVFDASLKKRIASSTLDDWDRVGWRGIMFESGDVWIRSKEDAPNEPLKISVVNYSGPAEQKLRQQALIQQKNKMHASVRQFSQPRLLFKTQNYLIRIDDLANEQLRYAAWKKPFNQSLQPELVLHKGELTVEGTANNESYFFKSGPYRYEVNYNRMGGESDFPLILTVYKNDQIILKEYGDFVK